MTIRQFRIFIAVASSESISRAAEELYLTQPTVSAAIREIERHYGTRFFERINQRLRITEAGKELLNYAVHLMDLYDEIENVFQNPDSAGVLRVGATPNIGSFYLPELIAEFQEAFPQIRVNVRVGPTEQVEKTLLDSSLDLAVAGGIFHSPLIEQTPLFHERYEAVCSPGHVMAGRTVTLSEFMEQPLLFRERDSGSFEAFHAAVAQFGKDVEPAWESYSQEALVEAACRGLGVTILPQRLAEREFGKKRLARIVLSDFSFRNTFYLVRHRQKFRSSAMEKLTEFLLRKLQQSPAARRNGAENPRDTSCEPAFPQLSIPGRYQQR